MFWGSYIVAAFLTHISNHAHSQIQHHAQVINSGIPRTQSLGHLSARQASMGIYQITQGVQRSSTACASRGMIMLLSPLRFCLCFPFTFCARQQKLSKVVGDEAWIAGSDVKDKA